MKINRTKNAMINIVFGYINKILSVLFPFAIKTIIIKTIGIEYLGLNSLFTSILNILNLAELGFGTAMVFSMYKPIAEDDKETIRALLNLYRKIYRIIGAIVLTVGLAIIPLLPFLIKGDHPADVNLYLLYIIYLANNVIGYFFFAYKTSLLSAHQRNDISSKINIIVQTAMYVLQIVVLILFKNYYIYIIFLPLSTLCINLYTAIKTKKMYPEYFCKGALDKEIKADIKKKIFALLFHKIGYVIQASIDGICISAFFGLYIEGVYSNYIYIINAINGFIQIFHQSIVAGIGNSIITEDKDYNKKQFNKILFIFSWVMTWCSVCLMCLFQPFMKVWVGTDKMLSITVVISFVLLFYTAAFNNVVSTYKDALGMWWEDKFKPLAISLVNLVGTLIFAYYGILEGVILITCFAYVAIGFPWETHVFYKNYFKEGEKEFYLKQLLFFVVTIAVTAGTYFLCYIIPLEGVKKIATNLAICIVVPNLLLFIFYYSIGFIDHKNFKQGVKKMGEKIKPTLKKVYYALPTKRIVNYEIKTLNNNIKLFRKLDKKYSKLINTNIVAEEKQSNYVFSCWLQGEENAPDIVKKCFSSMRKNLKGKKIVIITNENLSEYADLPEYIISKWKNGIITNTHFSDILRANLLAKYGGLWIDATALVTGDLSKFEKGDLFVFSNEHRHEDVFVAESWFIYAKANQPIIVNTLNLLYEYWKKNNKLAHYYLFHLFFTLCLKAMPEEWEKIPYYSSLDPHIIWHHEFYKTLNKERLEEIKTISPVHKLSTKFDESKLQENSFYENLIKDKI